MEWRCKWCGKPHEENDPPCDNCGHGHLERAVTPVAPEGEGGATIWVCTECGRDHPRNNPPCSRCGNMSFERRERRYDDIDATGGGWLAAVDRSVVVGFVGAVLVAALAIGTALGFIAIPGAGGERIPADQVPGDAETAEGLDLGGVEDAYVAALNDRRADAGAETLTRQERLDREATWYNRRVVQAEYADGSRPSGDQIREQFETVQACGDRIHVRPFVGADGDREGAALSSFDSERALAAALVEAYLRGNDGEFADASEGLVGVDVHVAPDGTVYVGQFLC